MCQDEQPCVDACEERNITLHGNECVRVQHLIADRGRVSLGLLEEVEELCGVLAPHPVPLWRLLLLQSSDRRCTGRLCERCIFTTARQEGHWYTHC